MDGMLPTWVGIGHSHVTPDNMLSMASQSKGLNSIQEGLTDASLGEKNP